MLATLETCRHTYNDSLEARRTTYKTTGKGLSYTDQANALVGNKNEYQQEVHSQVLQETLKRLDKSFQNFFRRVQLRKHGKKLKVGYPRRKSFNRYRSFCYPQSGFRLTNNNRRIELSKIGAVKLVYSRPTEGDIKTCRILKDADHWYVILTCQIEPATAKPNGKPAVGVDLGIKTFAALTDGSHVQNPRHFVKGARILAREQRKYSRKPKGTKNREKQRLKVARAHRKIRNQRDDFLHKTSRFFVDNYGLIVFERLNINGMVRNHKLAKHINDCAWGKLIQLTRNKAERAGSEVRAVDPRNTSQMCSGCGKIVPKTLADRIHCCPHCGLVMDRDDNASINILSRATDVTHRAGSARINAFGDPTSTPERHVFGQVGSVN